MSAAATRMPWGRYRGEELSAVPLSYLVWVIERAEGMYPSLRTGIEAELARRFSPPPSSTTNGHPTVLPADLRPMAEQLLRAGFRALAHAHHPDHGGDADMMLAVRATYETLCALLKVVT